MISLDMIFQNMIIQIIYLTPTNLVLLDIWITPKRWFGNGTHILKLESSVIPLLRRSKTSTNNRRFDCY